MTRANSELAAARAAFPSSRWTLSGADKTEDAISLLRYRNHQAGHPITYQEAEDIVFRNRSRPPRKVGPTTQARAQEQTPSPMKTCDRCFTVPAASGECLC